MEGALYQISIIIIIIINNELYSSTVFEDLFGIVDYKRYLYFYLELPNKFFKAFGKKQENKTHGKIGPIYNISP